jgi:hypothetical protein
MLDIKLISAGFWLIGCITERFTLADIGSAGFLCYQQGGLVMIFPS